MVDYTKKSYAKWILAGEHTVLRGGPALVFPFEKYFIQFGYKSTDAELSLKVNSSQDAMEMFFWGIVEKALNMVRKKRADLRGELTIDAQIPIGGGLGSSSALCVALMSWFEHLGWIDKNDIFSTSREIEHIIHGESSGVDIVGAMSEEGCLFYKTGELKKLSINWQPNWFISDCGQKGATASCITKVKSILEKTPDVGKKIDRLMISSVEMAIEGLALEDKEKGYELLAQSIDLASGAFSQWGLVHGSLKQHMLDLTKNGAIAVKPTGSGGGGYVLSLWARPPSPITCDGLGLIKL